MMKQITIFDIIAKDEQPKQLPPAIPYGYIKDFRIVGRELTFQDLKNYIGKRIIECISNESNQHFRVYKVIDYFEDCDTFYKRVRPLPDNTLHYGEIVNEYIHDVCGQKEAMACYEPYFTCDRVALSDKEGTDKANAWVSEAWCKDGRYDTGEANAYSFHQLLTGSM